MGFLLGRQVTQWEEGEFATSCTIYKDITPCADKDEMNLKFPYLAVDNESYQGGKHFWFYE